MTLEGYMIRFDTWENAIRASSGTEAMQAKLVAAALPLRTEDGLLDSFKLGLTLGKISRNMPPAELEDFQRTRIPGGDLNKVPLVRTPEGWQS